MILQNALLLTVLIFSLAPKAGAFNWQATSQANELVTSQSSPPVMPAAVEVYPVSDVFESLEKELFAAYPPKIKESCSHLEKRYEPLHYKCLQDYSFLSIRPENIAACHSKQSQALVYYQDYIKKIIELQKELSAKLEKSQAAESDGWEIQGQRVSIPSDDFLEELNTPTLATLGEIREMEMSFTWKEWPQVLANEAFRTCMKTESKNP